MAKWDWNGFERSTCTGGEHTRQGKWKSEEKCPTFCRNQELLWAQHGIKTDPNSDARQMPVRKQKLETPYELLNQTKMVRFPRVCMLFPQVQ